MTHNTCWNRTGCLNGIWENRIKDRIVINYAVHRTTEINIIHRSCLCVHVYIIFQTIAVFSNRNTIYLA